ncbi:putative RDD family membrane protein YckC [Sinobacterium caligoides]|uniref:Putative RDD family membrane protein YckC n=1 Tax=Sinobacterium caligoides TaxID=933926 RepID=A0A3N2E0P5_9GAMM|nr:RDD family protein [Sinobacterium caligoides]ROS05680.1 putative RDD family membrane protein YckC [Sinobacterium caligoides]
MNKDVVYSGFWERTLAALVDNIWIAILVDAILLVLYGSTTINVDDYISLLLRFAVPMLLIVWFWACHASSPGKMMFNLTIVDADSLNQVSKRRLIIRFLAYVVSFVPLLIGFIWMGFDNRKQGWHDKLANTVVVKNEY